MLVSTKSANGPGAGPVREATSLKLLIHDETAGSMFVESTDTSLQIAESWGIATASNAPDCVISASVTALP